MGKRGKLFALASTATMLVVVALLGTWSREPSYRGRPLTSWLEQYSDAALNEVQRRSEAGKAIQAIGAEKAQRRLLRMAEAQDSPFRRWVIEKTENRHLRRWWLREAAMTQLLGIAGFEALGTNCASAVPELTRLMQDTNHAFTALRCLVYIGTPAETPICQALTNPSPQIRSLAASQLSWVTDDIEVYLARLNGPLNDPDASVRFAAVQALGLQTAYPEEVLPLLLKATHDTQDSVAGYAIRFLGELGTNGTKALGPLTEFVEKGSRYRASHALRSLTSIAPERALPLALAWLRSSDPDRQARAVRVLGGFATLTAEVLEALKKATADADTNVAREATFTLRDCRDKEWSKGGRKVVIDGEPSYNGKRLSTWLMQRPNENGLSPEAQEAIRQMGTNAIPALLARLVYRDAKFGLLDNEAAMEAIGGFYVLGARGEPALPELQELVNRPDRDLALYALIASSCVGTNAVSVAVGALTNRHADVRNQALCLLWDGPLQSCRQARKAAVPQIIRLLHDPDSSARENSTNALKAIDPEAAARLGIK
jgi:HEAT repeat protein